MRRGGLAVRLRPALAALAWLSVGAAPVAAQAEGERDQVLAVATAALEAITREDAVAFTDLMVPEAVTFSVREREGRLLYGSRTRAENREGRLPEIVERGFEPEVRVAGGVALVWMPYDLYIDGAWSHCGVDTFTMVRNDEGWRIAAMAWSVEQPPACRPHPDGPPGA